MSTIARVLLATIDGDYPTSWRLRAAQDLHALVTSGHATLPTHPVIRDARDLVATIRGLGGGR